MTDADWWEGEGVSKEEKTEKMDTHGCSPGQKKVAVLFHFLPANSVCPALLHDLCVVCALALSIVLFASNVMQKNQTNKQTIIIRDAPIPI